MVLDRGPGYNEWLACVDGWQGTLEGGNSKQWWVAGKDLGTEPFRWAITEGPAGRLLATSGTFALPSESNACG